MIEFSWKFVTYENGNQYIDWEAVWDGDNSNDILKSGNHEHPFFETASYQTEEKTYESMKNASPDYFTKTIEVIGENGVAEKVNIFDEDFIKNFNLEDHNPQNIRKIGDIVAANPVTISICEMLSNPQDLHKHSGNTPPGVYREKLLVILDMLWD